MTQLKKLSWLLLGCLTGCQMHQESDVVVKKYVHRYGVEVPPDEWVEQGKSGQVVEVLQNGVTMTSSYRDGVLDGTVTYSFPHRSNIERMSVYVNGELQRSQLFFPSGTVRAEEDRKEDGTKCCRDFYENGTLRCIENYEGERLVEGQYYNLDFALESQVATGAGKRIERDAFGQLLFVDTLENGALTLRTYQHPNNMPYMCCPYVDGKVHGTVRSYMPGGDPRSIEQWANGEQHGLTSYYADGECVGEVYYTCGKRVGVEKRFTDQGKRVVEEINWVNGEKHGPSYSYLEGTKVENWYFRGKKVSKNDFDHRNAAPLH